MNKFMTWLKSIRLDRILTIFFASLVLFVTTACSNGPVSAKTADGVTTADKIRPEVPEKAITNPYRGGMNDYNDVDARRDTSGVQTKAKGLVDNSQGNLQKRADNPGQYVENYREGTPLGERTRRIGEDVGSSTKEVVGGATQGVKQGIQNIKENAQDASGYLKKTGKETVDAGQD